MQLSDQGHRRPPTFGKLKVDSKVNLLIPQPIKPTTCLTDTEVMSKLLGRGYTKHRVPDDHGIEVTVEFWIQEISAISELTSDFDMDIYVNELWYDKNLNFSDIFACNDNITLDHAGLSKVWMPNNCFITTKVAEIHDSPFKNVFFTMLRNGTVWVNYRVRVRGPCAMDLSKFPMDSQDCSLVYISFNYNNAEVKLRWNHDRPDPVYPLRKLMLPDFDLVKIVPEMTEILYPAGKWDALTVTFTFKRRYVWYFMQAFVPTYLTIFISWIAFSLSPRAIPARTLLGVNAILAQIFQFGAMRNLLPRVSYIKAIDVWILGSMTFVFASLVELAIVGYQAKKADAAKKKVFADYTEISIPVKSLNTEQAVYANDDNFDDNDSLRPCCFHQHAFIAFLKSQQVDFYAKIFFPALYSLFNIFYWCHYGLSD
uniref:Neurotransmitter-gated ion-channel ligand binding domain protein n=1 Tax=Panagrellus redivivus TaxID=6233 RepID=A0A7E5A244_PANRE